MAKILQPQQTDDPTQDDWLLSVERSNNELDDRIGTLESSLSLTSPDGTTYRIIVANGGTLSTEVIS